MRQLVEGKEYLFSQRNIAAAQPELSMSLLGELCDNRVGVHPDVFALDCAIVGDLEDVEESKREWLAIAGNPEWGAPGDAFPKTFVDQESVAVVAAERRDFVSVEVGVEAFIEGARLFFAGERTERRPNYVVVDVVNEGGEHPFDIVLAFVAEVLVNDVIHLRLGEGGHAVSPFVVYLSRCETIVLGKSCQAMAGTREDLGRGRVNQKRRTRQALLDAASRLVAVGQTPTLAEVAEAALVSRATAYRYFPSVEALLVEAFFEQEFPTTEELFADGVEDAVERVARVEEGANGLFFDHEVQVHVVVRSLLEAWLANEGEEQAARPGRRLVLLDAALAPLTKTLGRKRRMQLRNALAMTIGTEAVLVTRDVCGLSVEEARAVTKWASAALVRQALLEAPDEG